MLEGSRGKRRGSEIRSVGREVEAAALRGFR